MCFSIDTDAQQRLQDYLGQLRRFLTDKRQVASFATYMMGLLSPLERKSLEPIASQACPCPHHCSAAHQRLQQFGTDSPWPDEPIRDTAVHYGLGQMLRHGPIQVSILDDTAILKKGKHSVGVQSQYAGCVGKVANCQVAPSLVVANQFAHLPVDVELYLPKSWTDSPERRKEARIPDEVQFRTKPIMGLAMLDAAMAQGIPLGVLTADTSYGNSQEFRNGVRKRGLHYLVGVQGATSVQLWDRSQGFLPSQSVSQIGQALMEKDFAIYTIPGSPKPRHVRLCFRHVFVPGDTQDTRQWLIIEWRPEEKDPLRYYLCSLPKSTRRRRLIQILKMRWRTEQAYAEVKGELGFDHYEGRRWRGFRHHMTLVLCCYAFVIAERERSFPPCAAKKQPGGAELAPATASRPHQLCDLAAPGGPSGLGHARPLRAAA
jgi:SRSO17 transposase